MRGWQSVSFVWLMFMLPSCVPPPLMERATASTIRDSFTGGTPELKGRPYPYFNKDNLKAAIDPSSPEGEPGVGVLDNGNAGGFAALSYAFGIQIVFPAAPSGWNASAPVLSEFTPPIPAAAESPKPK